MDVSQYLEIFIDETNGHLQTLSDSIMQLEKEPENKDVINEIFRAAHSLKGMAGTMGFKRMQRLTHDMENVFQEIRSDRMKVTSSLIDVLFDCLDAIDGYLENVKETSDEGTNDNEAIVKELNDILAGGAEESEAVPAAEPEAPAQETKAVTNYMDFELNNKEKDDIKEAQDAGHKVYAITVKIQKECLLKAARAFLVFKAVEDFGQIIVYRPSSQDIEDEKFEDEFSFFLDSEETDFEKIKAAANAVSEIETVTGEEIPVAAFEGGAEEEKTEEPEKAEAPAETHPAPTKTAQAPASTEKKAAGKSKSTPKPVTNRTIRVDIEKLDALMNQVSELIIAKNSLVSLSMTGENKEDQVQTFQEQIEYLERITTNLHESVMKVRMVPIESVVNRFPRMIRDLNRKLNKKMELYMTGEDTELDRTVIDELGDPLMHLLRNSADHGLESNEERVRLGKPEVGSIYLDAYQDGNNVTIEVRDDGAGINIEKVKSKAIEKGTITEQQAETMTEKDFIDLLFRPSFSTADKISDVSGRGVGLDVVKTKIESLGGSIEAKTVKGEGSTFTIQLPLTLAIIQALMVEVGKEKYAIPLGNIDTIEDIALDEIKLVQSKEVIHLRGSVIPIVRMNEVLEMEDYEHDSESKSMVVVVVKKGDQRLGLGVDNLLGQQETVIKSMGHHITNAKLFSGATILGDGEVALILDTNTLV